MSHRLAILGHANQTVTDLYIEIPVGDQIAALNRAALIIDGEAQPNVLAMVAPKKTPRTTGRAAKSV